MFNLYIAAGDSTGSLSFTHATMKDRNIWSRILNSMTLLLNIPNGLVVFFPSKAFMNTFLTVIKQEKNQNYEKLVSTLVPYK